MASESVTTANVRAAGVPRRNATNASEPPRLPVASTAKNHGLKASAGPSDTSSVTYFRASGS